MILRRNINVWQYTCMFKTRLLSNLRPTTREWVHLVTRGHFRSRDIDCGHTIRSAILENPMLHANFISLCFIETELLPIKVFIAAILDLFLQ